MSLPEQSLYALLPIKKRIIIPKLITLVVLSGLFYIGIVLNLALININQPTENIIHLIGIIIIASCLLVGIALAIRQSKQSYYFYKDRIIIGTKQIFYTEISQYTTKKNTWDKLFATYSLSLNNNFALRNIPLAINIADYVKQLVNYNQAKMF